MCINIILNLKFFGLGPKARNIRSQMLAYHDPAEMGPLLKWSITLGCGDVDWSSVFENIYQISNNFKLIQFQYKLLMRNSTCRYKRKLMNIVKDDKCDRNTCLYVIADCIIETQVHLANLFNVHLISTNDPEPGTECKHKVARLNGDALNRTHDVLPAQVAADPCPFRGIF